MLDDKHYVPRLVELWNEDPVVLSHPGMSCRLVLLDTLPLAHRCQRQPSSSISHALLVHEIRSLSVPRMTSLEIPSTVAKLGAAMVQETPRHLGERHEACQGCPSTTEQQEAKPTCTSQGSCTHSEAATSPLMRSAQQPHETPGRATPGYTWS